MLDLKLIREKPEAIKQLLRKKFVDPLKIDNILDIDAEKRNLQQEFESLQAKKNRASERIPLVEKEEREKMLKELQYVKEQTANLEPKLQKLDDELNNLLITLPNLPLETVPEGEDESQNVVIRTFGEKPQFDFPILDHVELGKRLDLIDIENAVKTSGARFYFLKNDLVLLEFALVSYVLEKLIKKGFAPIIPPVLVKEQAMFGTGFFPADKNEIYHVNPEDDDLYLVGTSEVALCGLHQDQVLKEENLPLRYAGFSTCFRREAGSYGKDTHGILRVHQFDKVEMFSFCHPDASRQEHEFLIGIEEEIMQELGFHYQTVEMCGGELRNSPAARKVDIEVWIPSQNKFRELTSCSNCTDFQARRMNIKFKRAKANEVIHTLNGTAVAIARTLLAIMENYQTKDGHIRIPAVLQAFMHGKKEI